MYSWKDIYVLKLILQHQFILTVADENGVHLGSLCELCIVNKVKQNLYETSVLGVLMHSSYLSALLLLGGKHHIFQSNHISNFL